MINPAIFNSRRTSLRALAATGVLALATASAALAAGGNAGDVWTDNVGQPSGPGHEQDPHLVCQDINLWGAHLADGSGSYTIDGWPPSGSQEQDYASTWTYSAAKGGPQVIDVINVKTLIANAAAHGDAPVNKQGYHFKLQFAQDPQKHKTFWVNCPAPSPGVPSGGNTGGGTPPPVVTPVGNPSSSSTPTTPAGSPRPKRAVKGAHFKRHRHKLVAPARHVRPQRDTRKAHPDGAPAFTG
jgi:hypothetical protein